MRVAAVDCGTNSIRLLIRDLPGAELHREMRIVRLGEGVDQTGMLSDAALERTRLALVDYAASCASYEVEKIRMVATSATRDASNRRSFVDLVTSALGVEPEVISGDEEASLSFSGATADLPVDDGPFLVLDIGGGSTEFVLGTASVLAARSVDVGCVRLTERHLISDPPTRAQIAAATSDIDAALSLALSVVPAADARTVVGLAGSVTTLAALNLRLEAYDSAKIHLSRITADQVRSLTDQLLGMSRAERAAMPVMHPGRVDVIGGGALVLRCIVDRLGLDDVLVSESDILDGIAASMKEI